MKEIHRYEKWFVCMPARFMLILPMIAVFITAGCAGESNPIVPDDWNGINAVCPGTYTSSANRQLWGMWTVRISGDHHSATAIPQRSTAMHLNAVNFLENDPCTTCLSVSNLVPYPDNRLSIDLTLVHPFPGRPKLSGFDVRGVFISDADYRFPVTGRKIAWKSNLPRLLLPNGYTTLFNPVEYDPSLPGPDCLQYIPGTFSRGSCDATLNGYVAYRREAPRRMFEPGGCETRTVWLEIPAGGFEFGYVVDCCWQKFDGPCIDPLVDFPPDANCLEAYNVDVRLGSNLQPVAGSTQPIEVQVFDHQGLDTVSAVVVEAPELFSGEVRLEYLEDVGIQTHMFVGTIENEYGVGAGIYPMLVHVIDTEEDQNLGQIDAWFLYCVEVGSRRGWVRTWGSDAEFGDANARSVVVDIDGFIYVTGQIYDITDLDPGEDTDWRSVSYGGIYLSKFNSDGDYIWGCTWDSPSIDKGYDLAVDPKGDILIMMAFDYPIDLDPGPGTDFHNAGFSVSKLDTDGNFIWGKSWHTDDNRWDLEVDGLGNVFICGTFLTETDMDPGEGEDVRRPNGFRDCCLIKLDSNGDFMWARTWGGPGNENTDGDYAWWAAGTSDGQVFVVGHVRKTIDFDPGANVVEAGPGYFLSRFAPTGKFLGVNVWEVPIHNLAVDKADNLFITGYIYSRSTIDFDMGPGIDAHQGPNAYIVSYSPNGDLLWVRTWGLDLVSPRNLAIAPTNEIFIAGTFDWNLVDFDPSEYTDYQTSVDNDDVFCTKYLLNGEYQWTRTWGSSEDDRPNGVATDASGNSYIVGDFRSHVDFDPGPGFEYHEAPGSPDAYLIKLPPDGNW